MFTIDSGIPVPAKSKRGKSEQYPFSQLAVSDSFFVPNTESPTGDAVKTLVRTAYSAEKRLGKLGTNARFTVRASESNGVQGARVWRTE